MKRRILVFASILFLSFIFLPAQSFARDYIYIIDKSGSMRKFKTKVEDAITQDFGNAATGKKAFFRDGDVIHLWYFDVDVYDVLTIHFTRASAESVKTQFINKLKDMKFGKNTDIEKPLYKAFYDFRDIKGQIAIFLYTDGQDTVNKKTFGAILRLYNKNYKADQRLKGIWLVHFGSTNVTDSVKNVLRETKGIVVQAGKNQDISAKGLTDIQVEIDPKAINVDRVISQEVSIEQPFKFIVTPKGKTARLDFSLETKTGSWTMSPSYLIIDKNSQFVFVFSGKKIPVGIHRATLKISSNVTVNPTEIPMTINIKASEHVKIGAKIDNPMIVGRPIRVQAKLNPIQKGELKVSVTKPDNDTEKIRLFDDGTALHADNKANDMVYSGIFEDTKELGRYKMHFTGTGPAGGVEDNIINEPVLFEFSHSTLEKKGIVASKLNNPIELKFEVNSDSLKPVTIECAKEKLEVNGKLIGSVRIKDPVINKGKQTLVLQISPKSTNIKGDYSFKVPLKIGPVQNRMTDYSLSISLGFKSALYDTILNILSILITIIVLLAIWIFIIVPLAWKKRLKNARNIFVDIDGNNSVLSVACRKKRFNSLYKIFSLFPRASFGGSKRCDILVPGGQTLMGYFYPQTIKNKVNVKAATKLSFTDGIERSKGQSRALTKGDDISIQFDSRQITIV